MIVKGALFVLALLVSSPIAWAQPDGVTFEVTFQLNDALMKGKVLEGVGIGIAVQAAEPDAGPADGPSADRDPLAAEERFLVKGRTDGDGRFVTRLAPGPYLVTYMKTGYVPVDNSPIRVGPEKLVVTTTLSMLLEAEGETGRNRVRILLNWGSDHSQVQDVDSHLLCPCGQPDPEVYYSRKEHKGSNGHRVTLDVDDVDWAGPETITLFDPRPGEYIYWVHDYSGDSSAKLGQAGVVVRVLVGDRVAGEFPIPNSITARNWLPFKMLKVDELMQVSLVPFTDQELKTEVPTQAPAGAPSVDDHEDYDDESFYGVLFVAGFIFLIFMIRAIARKKSRS